MGYIGMACHKLTVVDTPRHRSLGAVLFRRLSQDCNLHRPVDTPTVDLNEHTCRVSTPAFRKSFQLDLCNGTIRSLTAVVLIPPG